MLSVSRSKEESSNMIHHRFGWYLHVISSKNPQLFAQKTVPTADVLRGGLSSTASCEVLRRCPQLDVCFENRNGSNDADGKLGNPMEIPQNPEKNMKT